MQRDHEKGTISLVSLSGAANKEAEKMPRRRIVVIPPMYGVGEAWEYDNWMQSITACHVEWSVRQQGMGAAYESHASMGEDGGRGGRGEVTWESKYGAPLKGS